MSATLSLLRRRPWRRRGRSGQPAPTPALSTHQLVELRAALAAGLAPGQALLVAADGVLAGVARSVRLGGSLYDEGCRIASGDAGADLLVRALGIAERAGAGAGTAVDQALAAARATREIERLLAAKTAQARGTARVLTAVPLGIWLLVLVTDPAASAFYRTVPGVVCALLTALLLTGGHVWTRRLLHGAAGAARLADPLAPAPARWDTRRALVAAAAPFTLAPLTLGVLPGLAIAALAAVLGGRRRLDDAHDPSVTPDAPPAVTRRGGQPFTDGGTAEAVELVAVALAAGLPLTAAVGLVAPLAPRAARAPLAVAARRMRGGWRTAEAFADDGLRELGAVLDTAQRWGAPAADVLRGLADGLRADRRAAAEEAAERVQLALVFPTTLLTLPAFLVGVVPPLVWSAFRW